MGLAKARGWRSSLLRGALGGAVGLGVALASAGVASAASTITAPVGGSVSDTLGIVVTGGPGSLGTFIPGVAATYGTTMTVNVTSTAAATALTALDPSETSTGLLVNEPFALNSPLQVDATSSNASATSFGFLPLSSSPTSPITVLSYSAPVTSDPVTVGFQQPIAATDPLRTGTYAKTITLTLTETTP
jgi:hypothetical protein